MTTYFHWYQIDRSESYRTETMRTDAFEASITKRFVNGRCVYVWLAYQAGEHISVQEFNSNSRPVLSAWKLCSAVDLAERYVKKITRAQEHIA